MSSSFPSTYSSLPIILLQECCSRNVWTFFCKIFGQLWSCFPVFESYQWFTSCDEPSVFTLVKFSLDCWLCHRYTTWGDFLDLANRCVGFFLHQGKISSLIHHSCFLGSSRPFGGAFCLLRTAPRNVFGIPLMGFYKKKINKKKSAAFKKGSNSFIIHPIWMPLSIYQWT